MKLWIMLATVVLAPYSKALGGWEVRCTQPENKVILVESSATDQSWEDTYVKALAIRMQQILPSESELKNRIKELSDPSSGLIRLFRNVHSMIHTYIEIRFFVKNKEFSLEYNIKKIGPIFGNISNRSKRESSPCIAQGSNISQENSYIMMVIKSFQDVSENLYLLKNEMLEIKFSSIEELKKSYDEGDFDGDLISQYVFQKYGVEFREKYPKSGWLDPNDREKVCKYYSMATTEFQFDSVLNGLYIKSITDDEYPIYTGKHGSGFIDMKHTIFGEFNDSEKKHLNGGLHHYGSLRRFYERLGRNERDIKEDTKVKFKNGVVGIEVPNFMTSGQVKKSIFPKKWSMQEILMACKIGSMLYQYKFYGEKSKKVDRFDFTYVFYEQKRGKRVRKTVNIILAAHESGGTRTCYPNLEDQDTYMNGYLSDRIESLLEYVWTDYYLVVEFIRYIENRLIYRRFTRSNPNGKKIGWTRISMDAFSMRTEKGWSEKLRNRE